MREVRIRASIGWLGRQEVLKVPSSYPEQPLPFLTWLASKVGSQDIPCAVAMFETGGVLSLITPSGGRLLWLPPDCQTRHAFRVKGLIGKLLPVNLDRRVAEGLAIRLSNIVSRFDPAPLAFGPQSGPVEFTVNSLGGLLRRHLLEGSTEWGPYLFGHMRQIDPYSIELCFVRKSERRPAVVFKLMLPGQSTPPDGFRREDIQLERLQDDRGKQEMRRLDHQIERLIGFSLGRALAYNPSISVPGSLTEDARDTKASLSVGQKPSIEQLLDRVRFPYELGQSMFFRPWGGNFVANEMVLHSPGLGTLVCHSNRECLCALIPPTGSYERYHCCPWPRDMEDARARWITDFDDLAVTRGGQERLYSAVSKAVQQSGNRPVFVIEMCEYQAMGEDVEGVVNMVRRNTGGHIITHENVFTEGPLAGLDNRWAPILSSILEKERDKNPVGIVLCGYCLPRTKVHEELKKLFSSVGIELLAVVFPYLDTTSVAALSKASLWVINPWTVVEKGLGRAVDALGLHAIRAPTPFGFEGTKKWLLQISAALGKPIGEQLEEHIGTLKPAWERIFSMLSDKRAGLVVPAHDALAALSPHVFYGLDPISMLKELGIRPCVILYDASDDRVPALPDGVEVFVASSHESISETIRSAGCDLVYSDYAADTRVLKAGAMPFSIRLVESGLEGAIRTGLRLLSRCTTPFFRRYAGYLFGGGP